MEYKDLKKIIELIRQNDLTEFEMEEEGFKLSVKANPKDGASVINQMAPAPYPMAAPMLMPAPALDPLAGVPGAGHVGAAPAPASTAPAVDLPSIKSPMVGTFYAASSPDSPPFVKVGDRVDSETVVCIIECMKVMNEIKAGISGVIKEAKLTNATPVEFNQVLYTIEPS